MSTLKVDTLQPNAQAAVTLDSSAIVTGASTLTGNVTASGNVNVAGTLATSGTLTATKVALNGVSPGSSNGDVTGVNALSCNSLTSSGAVNASSLAVTSGASVGSLTIGGAAYEQRVVAHVSLDLGREVLQNAPFNFYNYPAVTITERRKKGFGNITWVGLSNTGHFQLNLSPSLSQTQYTVVVEILESSKRVSIYPADYTWASNSRLEIRGWIPVPGAVTSNLPYPKARYINVTILG